MLDWALRQLGHFVYSKCPFFVAFLLLLSSAMSGAALEPLDQISGGFQQVPASSQGS